MNFKLEFSFAKIFDKLKQFIKNAKFEEVIQILSKHKNYFGLSILLVSLFTFNYAINQDKSKKKFESVKDLTPGKIQVFEGKVFKIDKINSNVIAIENLIETIEKIKKNSIIVNRILSKIETKEINSFVFYDRTGSIELHIDPEYKNFNLSDYFINDKISQSYLKISGIEKVIQEENIIQKSIKHKDIVRLKISLPYEIEIFKRSLNSNNFELFLGGDEISNKSELKFFIPTTISLIEYNIILNFLKVGFISAHLVGIIYFSYKIFKKYFIKKSNVENRKTGRKNYPALTSGSQ